MSIGKVSTKIYYGYTTHNKVKLIRGGKSYFDLLEQLITNAQYIIHLHCYIYEEDETGIQIANALIAAAKRNVQVFLVVDGYASKKLSHSFLHHLKTSGIHFLFYNPLFKSKHFYFGRRMHHKIAVIDETYSLVGGINISNRYNDMPNEPAWLDFALYAEGEVSEQLSAVCQKPWKKFSTLDSILHEKIDLKDVFKTTEECLVRIRRNDWIRRELQISKSYLEMFRKSSSHITILSSYFLPGRTLRKRLIAAAKRGIKVKVILAGLSDVMLAKYAERYLYNWLLKNNIEIYEYQKSILHGKLAVCDNEWLTIGSYNVNNISAYASIELNLDVRNTAFATAVSNTLEQIIVDDCVCIDEENFKQNNNLVKRFVHWICYEFIRIAFYLFTFYFIQKAKI